MKWVKPQSLYLQLLLFLGLPLLLLWGLSAFNSYVSALQAATGLMIERCYPLPARYQSGWWCITAGWRSTFPGWCSTVLNSI